MKETKDSAFSLRGEVIIKDTNTGKVLVHKHNMIVNGGLDFIRWAILSRLGLPDDENNNDASLRKLNTKYNGKTISLCVNFGTGVKDSYLEMDELDNKLILEKLNDVSPEISYNTDKNRLELIISVSNEATTAQEYISELGIFLKSGESETMFSRVTFDPILFSSSTPFSLTYYIYL